MSPSVLTLLLLCILVVAILYSSVGHGAGSEFRGHHTSRRGDGEEGIQKQLIVDKNFRRFNLALCRDSRDWMHLGHYIM